MQILECEGYRVHNLYVTEIARNVETDSLIEIQIATLKACNRGITIAAGIDYKISLLKCRIYFIILIL